MAQLGRNELIAKAKKKESVERAGLAGVDLSGAALDGLTLIRSDLSGANLENAKIAAGAPAVLVVQRGIPRRG